MDVRSPAADGRTPTLGLPANGGQDQQPDAEDAKPHHQPVVLEPPPGRRVGRLDDRLSDEPRDLLESYWSSADGSAGSSSRGAPVETWKPGGSVSFSDRLELWDGGARSARRGLDGYASFTSRAARLPDSMAPFIHAYQSDVCSPAKWMCPSGAAT